MILDKRCAALFLGLTALAASAAPSTAQAPEPVYGYVFTPEPAAGTPRILKIELNSSDLHAGGPILIRVTTTKDVTSVTTGNGAQGGPLGRVAPGVFTSTSTLPRMGSFFRVHLKLHFSATTAAGAEADADVPVTFK